MVEKHCSKQTFVRILKLVLCSVLPSYVALSVGFKISARYASNIKFAVALFQLLILAIF